MQVSAPLAVFCLAVLAAGSAGAASPDYCSVYAKEISKQTLSANKSNLSADRVHDRLYHKCLNMDEEPALPAAYAETPLDGIGGSLADERSIDNRSMESIVEEATSESPTVDATAIDESVVKRTAAIESKKATTPATRQGQWSGSGYAMWSPEWRSWCEEHFPNSFDPESGTVLPYDKTEREPCI